MNKMQFQKEKSFLTKVYANNLNDIIKIGRFLAEKHLNSYLNKREQIREFFKKYQTKDGRIIFPLRHKLFILYK